MSLIKITARYVCTAFLILTAITCREKYLFTVPGPDTGFLVVEGFINVKGATTINLSRTTPLSERKVASESGAVVRIESEDNNVYPLKEVQSGKYVSETLQLNTSAKYRLYIKTKGNKEYASDFRNVIITPPVDSVSWKRDRGIQFYVHSSGGQNDARYFKWDYVEDWEVRSRFYASLDLLHEPQLRLGYIDSVNFKFDSSRYFCFQTRINTHSILGSTAQLSDNRIAMPIKFLENNGWELDWLYCITVKQLGLSKEGFDFYERLRKNTETMGSVFDAQPSEMNSNIMCLSDPDEIVLGFIEPTSLSENRKFVSIGELPGWFFYMPCGTEGEGINVPAVLEYMVVNDLLPTRVRETDSTGITKFGIGPAICVDCRIRGTNDKPSYWPW